MVEPVTVTVVVVGVVVGVGVPDAVGVAVPDTLDEPAALVTPFVQEGDIAALCDLLLAEGFEVLATSPSGREALGDIAPRGRQAVLFGAEGPGLPRAILDRLRTVRISMRGGFDSLNVATTSGIVLHHLAR